MIGTHYWATGIVAHYDGFAWWAEVEFYDDGFAQQGSTEGKLISRYVRQGGPDALTYQIDLVKADAERLGIEFREIDGRLPRLYVPGDGEDETVELPDGWQRLLAEQAERLGWESAYRVPA